MQSLHHTLTPHRTLLHKRAVPHAQYLAALEAYWDEKPVRTIQLVTEALLTSETLATQFPLYRLWIEQSTQRNEKQSLKDLLQYLLEESVADGDITWVALRGLIHLELEEMGACKLLLPFLSEQKDNPYCLEFLCKYHSRTSAPSYTFSLQKTHIPSLDYFHWVPILSNTHLHADVISFVAEAFPHSPLLTFCRLQHAMSTLPSSSLFPYAQTELHALRTRYIHSATLRYCADAWNALQTKEKKDVQSVSQGEHRIDPVIYNLFRGFVAAGGLSPLAPNEQKDSLESANLPALPMKAEEPDMPALKQQSWLFLVSPHTFYEWMTAPFEGIREVPASTSMQHRDTICWASTFTKNGKPAYRVGGLLEVLTAPKFHPLWKHSVSVRLIDHQTESIPLDFFLSENQLNQGKEIESESLTFCPLEEAQFISVLEQMARHQEERLVEGAKAGRYAKLS
jgi:hypothetical protein